MGSQIVSLPDHRTSRGCTRPVDAHLPCPLCGRPLVPGPSVNAHHLVPRSYGGQETVTLHRICHAKIHSLFHEQELRDRYFTMARLRAHPEIAKFVRWVRKKDPEYVGRNAPSQRKRRR
jgi:5-methylcytosine-specific restriction endonuclease McrA